LVVVAVVVYSNCQSASAAPLWGFVGHQITASIAQQLLDPSAINQIDYLLANYSGDMYQVASWADSILSQSSWQWSAPLHYINTPSWQCSYNPAKDCGINNNGMCLGNAIANYTSQLASTTSHNVAEIAVRFVIHFLGDIHNPLHVAFAADKGGNTITGKYFGQSANLHKVWDTLIISGRIQYSFGGSQSAYVNYIVSQIMGPWQEEAKQWAACPSSNFDNSTVEETQPLDCPNEWANDSAALACQYAYKDQSGNKILNGFDLADPYYQYVKDIVDKQLAKGGIRLATTLNKIWPTSS